LGNGGIASRSAFGNGECASITFDARGRLVTVCVGVAGPTLKLLDPVTLDELATYALPPRQPGSGDPFTNFSGGGYFYLDDRDQAVVPTTTRHVFVIAERPGPAFARVADYDLTGAVGLGDQILSALPDWSGRIWFATKQGVVGTVDPATGGVRAIALHEPIGNSLAVDETGGVYVVSDAALYRLDAAPDGAPRTTWREAYANIGTVKPGQTEAGSGTTPTLMGRDLVAITDNADPMNVVVYRRAATVSGARQVCAVPVFDAGASSTDQSLVATPTAMIVENNYGYSGPTATERGRTTTPGLQRVDLDADGRGCHTVWRSGETAPSVVPKLSLGGGLVYTYTKDARADGQDAWYLTALDFRTGRTVFKRLGGEGLGFNNNYAPVTLGPDGTAYLGVLGGIVRWRDASGPAGGAAPSGVAGRPRAQLRLRVSCARPLAATARHRHARRFAALVRMRDGRRVRLTAPVPRC
jgi:hypothetical protein